MDFRCVWFLAWSLASLPMGACAGSKGGGTFQTFGSGSSSGGSSDDGPSPLTGLDDGGGGGAQLNITDSEGGSGSVANLCKGGHYVGTFDGSYSSNLIVGIPLKVSGNVDMTLNQAGSAGTTCTFVGETESCSNFFKLSGGTVTGVATSAKIDPLDPTMSGYPYFCTMTGTLDCKAKKLIGGWIQCTYCVTALADGGTACTQAIAGLGGGIGGQFAGPVTAAYDTNTLSFVNGTWNGAEALAGNNGTSPGPNGGPISSYLALDGGYGIGNYGGSGTWNAMHQ